MSERNNFHKLLMNYESSQTIREKVQTDMRVIELSKLQQLTEAFVLQRFCLSVGDSSHNASGRKFTVTLREQRSLMQFPNNKDQRQCCRPSAARVCMKNSITLHSYFAAHATKDNFLHFALLLFIALELITINLMLC